MEGRQRQILDTLREEVDAFMREAVTLGDDELPATLLEGRTALALALPDEPGLREALFVQMARQEAVLHVLACALEALERETGRPVVTTASTRDSD